MSPDENDDTPAVATEEMVPVSSTVSVTMAAAPEQVTLYRHGNTAIVSPADVPLMLSMGYAEASDERQFCPSCNADIGYADGRDRPGLRQACPVCHLEFCGACYGRDNPSAPLNHDCQPAPHDEARFVDG